MSPSQGPSLPKTRHSTSLDWLATRRLSLPLLWRPIKPRHKLVSNIAGWMHVLGCTLILSLNFFVSLKSSWTLKYPLMQWLGMRWLSLLLRWRQIKPRYKLVSNIVATIRILIFVFQLIFLICTLFFSIYFVSPNFFSISVYYFFFISLFSYTKFLLDDIM